MAKPGGGGDVFEGFVQPLPVADESLCTTMPLVNKHQN